MLRESDGRGVPNRRSPPSARRVDHDPAARPRDAGVQSGSLGPAKLDHAEPAVEEPKDSRTLGVSVLEGATIEAAVGDGEPPCPIAVARTAGRRARTVYAWSSGRITARVGAEGVRISRRDRRMWEDEGEGRNAIWLGDEQLRALEVACRDWRERRSEWAAFYVSSAGRPAGYGASTYYRPSGHCSQPVEVARLGLGPSWGEDFVGRNETVELRDPGSLRGGVEVIAETWRRGERYGPGAGSLVGLRHRIADDVFLDVERHNARVWRKHGGDVYLEPVSPAAPNLLFRERRPQRRSAASAAGIVHDGLGARMGESPREHLGFARGKVPTGYFHGNHFYVDDGDPIGPADGNCGRVLRALGEDLRGHGARNEDSLGDRHDPMRVSSRSVLSSGPRGPSLKMWPGRAIDVVPRRTHHDAANPSDLWSSLQPRAGRRPRGGEQPQIM